MSKTLQEAIQAFEIAQIAYEFLKKHITDKKVIEKAKNDVESVKFNYTQVENLITNAKSRIDWTNAETKNVHTKKNAYEVLLPAFLYMKDNYLNDPSQNPDQGDERLLQIRNEYEAKLEEKDLKIKQLEEQLNAFKSNQ